jgi:cbb3-type cytochrome oxidase subunit 3
MDPTLVAMFDVMAKGLFTGLFIGIVAWLYFKLAKPKNDK